MTFRKAKWISAALATMGMVIAQPTKAATYTYVGSVLDSGGHVEATVDLNCIGPCSGSYVYGAGLTSFTLSAFDNLNGLIFSINAADATYYGNGPDYIKFDALGAITEWWLLRTRYPILTYIYTINCPCYGAQDTYSLSLQIPNTSPLYYGSANRNGQWSAGSAAPAVPLPAALPLFAAGLGAMGFMGWRKRRKAA